MLCNLSFYKEDENDETKPSESISLTEETSPGNLEGEKKRKKKLIDGMDREIIRSIYNSRRSLTSRQIAKKVSLSGAAIFPRLNNLMDQGIVKSKTLGVRSFSRTFKGKVKPVKIKAPRSILWDIDLKKKKTKKK